MLFPVRGVGASPPSACNAGSCLHKTLPVSKVAQASYSQSIFFFQLMCNGWNKQNIETLLVFRKGQLNAQKQVMSLSTVILTRIKILRELNADES